MRDFRAKATVLTVATAIFIIGSQQAAAQQEKTYTLKYQHSYPPSLAFYSKTGMGFIERVEEWSNGRIKFEVYEAGALSSVGGMPEAVDQGVVDVAQSYGGFYVGDVPEGDVEIGLPLAWNSAYEAFDAYYNRGLKDVIAKAYESRFNVKYFPAIFSMKYVIATTKDIDGLDDLKGLKLRALGVYGEYVQALGAAPVVVPGPEMYTSLQLGTIDGLIYGAEAVVKQGLDEFVKSAIVSPYLNSGAGHWLINRDTWEALPSDLQQVVADAAKYGNAFSTMRYRAEVEMNIGTMSANGVKLVELSDADTARSKEIALMLWDKIGERSELAAEAVSIVRKQQREFGHIE